MELQQVFTGLISDIGTIVQRRAEGEGIRFRIATGFDVDGIAIGASIACGGICLTAVARGSADGYDWFDVDVSPETLDKTTAGDWHCDRRINLERSLCIGDELGGHLVSGHVDGVSKVIVMKPAGDYTSFRFSMSPAIAPFIAQKGSVCLDGTSLTVNSVLDDSFDVMIIPHTLSVTTWGEAGVGDNVNVEVDVMARYAARLASVGKEQTR